MSDYYFVCTDCHVSFDGLDDSGLKAKCPKCGEEYSHFFTKLIRGGTFALAYWMEDHPDIEIKSWRLPEELKDVEVVLARGEKLLDEHEETH